MNIVFENSLPEGFFSVKLEIFEFFFIWRRILDILLTTALKSPAQVERFLDFQQGVCRIKQEGSGRIYTRRRLKRPDASNV